MPLLYVAVPLSTVKYDAEGPVFAAWKEHPGQVGKVLVLGEISSLKDPTHNLRELRANFIEKYQHQEKYIPKKYKDDVSNFSIYCLDIPDETYFHSLKATPELFLDSQYFTIVGFYRAGKKCTNLQATLNSNSTENARRLFQEQFKKDFKKETLKPALENFPKVEVSSMLKATDKLPPAVLSPATSPLTSLPVKTKAPVNMLYVAVPLITFKPKGYWPDFSSWKDAQGYEGKVLVLGDVSSLQYPDATISELRQKFIEQYRNNEKFMPMQGILIEQHFTIFALHIHDENYFKSLKAIPELYLDARNFTIVGYCCATSDTDKHIKIVLNSELFGKETGRHAHSAFIEKTKQDPELAMARPDSAMFNMGVTATSSIIRNSDARKIIFNEDEEAWMQQSGDGFWQANKKYILPGLLFIGGLLLCAVGGGLLASLLWYSYLTTTLIITGISILTGGSVMLGGAAAATTYCALTKSDEVKREETQVEENKVIDAASYTKVTSASPEFKNTRKSVTYPAATFRPQSQELSRSRILSSEYFTDDTSRPTSLTAAQVAEIQGYTSNSPPPMDLLTFTKVKGPG